MAALGAMELANVELGVRLGLYESMHETGPATPSELAKAAGIAERQFRRGEGVEFGAFDLHDLQAAFTRPVFRHHLVQNWLPAMPEVQARLSAGEQVRVVEGGCGEGEAG